MIFRDISHPSLVVFQFCLTVRPRAERPFERARRLSKTRGCKRKAEYKREATVSTILAQEATDGFVTGTVAGSSQPSRGAKERPSTRESPHTGRSTVARPVFAG